MNTLIPELYCTDIQKSLAFYVDLCGFEIDYERKDEGFAMLKIGDARLMLDQLGKTRDWVAADLEPPFGRGMNLEISVENVDALYEKILAAGHTPFLEFEEKTYEVAGQPVTVRQFIAQDPDGYLLRFSQEI